MENKETFEQYLKKCNLSQNTLTSYLWTVSYYKEHYDYDYNYICEKFMDKIKKTEMALFMTMTNLLCF